MTKMEFDLTEKQIEKVKICANCIYSNFFFFKFDTFFNTFD
jgi:hypothetical protein